MNKRIITFLENFFAKRLVKENKSLKMKMFFRDSKPKFEIGNIVSDGVHDYVIIDFDYNTVTNQPQYVTYYIDRQQRPTIGQYVMDVAIADEQFKLMEITEKIDDNKNIR